VFSYFLVLVNVRGPELEFNWVFLV